jgi:hypothetical protein
MLCSKTTAKADAVALLERVMGQLVAQGASSSSGSKNFKPHVGCDVTMLELEGAYEVGDAVTELPVQCSGYLTALQQPYCLSILACAEG